MDGLPLELYSILFSYVDICDLFKLRLVNKKFEYLVSQCRIKELIVFNPETVDRYLNRFSTKHRDFVRYKSSWFSSNLPKNFLRLVDQSKLFILKEPVNSPLFFLKFLKRLKVDHFESSSCAFRLSDVNQFNRLEELEITVDAESHGGQLSLPNLQVLQISLHGYGYHLSFSINAAKLVAVCFGKVDGRFTSPCNFQFEHPLSITHLKTGDYDSSILAFSNLQHLEISRHSYFSPEILWKFTGLKELTVLGINRSRLDSIIHATSSNRSTLTIHHKLPIGVSHSINNFEFYSDCWMISYGQLVYSLRTIPPDFFVRFNDIQRVVVSSKVQDPDHLLEFLGNCSTLSDLKILNGSSLSQSFFVKLPTVCSLNWLKVDDERNLGLDLSFILKMSYLRCFETNQELSNDVICKLAEPFHLETVRFEFYRSRFNSMSISLQRSKDDRFLVSNYLELGLSDYSKKIKPVRLAKLLDTMRRKAADNSE